MKLSKLIWFVKFFKENNDKGKEILAFPTGDGGVETIKNSFETIHHVIPAFPDPIQHHKVALVPVQHSRHRHALNFVKPYFKDNTVAMD